MNVAITRHKLSVRPGYDIEAAGFGYVARSSSWLFGGGLDVSSKDGTAVACIRRRLSWFRNCYEFRLAGGDVYRFWCEKRWRRVFVCEGKGAPLRLYGHKGRNYSVFDGDRQIAAFARDSLVLGHGNNYDLRINRDANALVVTCIVLAVDAVDGRSSGNALTLDLGSIGAEARPFDGSWEPDCGV